MNKFAKGGLSAAIALVVATGAQAAGTFRSVTSETVGVEAATTGALEANIAGDSIVLRAGAAYASGAGARLILTLPDGATFADSTFTLEESAGGAGTGDLTHWTQGVKTATTLEFILGSSAVSAGDEFILSGSSVAGQAVNFVVPAAAAGTELSIDAQYKDSPSTVVEEYTALELFGYVNEFSANVDAVADAVVDVNDSRLSFTGGASSDTVALEFVEASVTNGVVLTDDDIVNVVLSGDMSGIDSLVMSTGGQTDVTANIDVAAGTATFAVSASDAFASTTSEVITATVDGATTLNTRTYTVQADLNFESETDKNLIAGGTAAGEWTINGLQAKVAHLSLNASGFVSWLKVVNESTIAADVSADIIWTLADGTEGSVSGASLGSADAGGILTIGEAAILAAMGNPTQLADVSMTVTVAAPNNLVHMTAEKKAADGRISVPVLYNVTGRNWLQ